jgi:hypothetical protein
MKEKMQITKVKKPNQKSEQLQTFIKSLGVEEKIELYSYNLLVYMNADILSCILSVPLEWFVKNAEIPMHYIKIKSKIYVNQYGITKFIAQSKEEVSFKLQDYLYELFYQVETNGTVSVKDLKSRDEFIKSMQSELKLYKSISDANNNLFNEMQSNNTILKNDYYAIELENEKLTNLVENLNLELKELNSTLNNYSNISNKLSNYITLNLENIPEDIEEDLINLDNLNNLDNLDKVDNLNNLNSLNNLNKTKITKVKSKTKLTNKTKVDKLTSNTKVDKVTSNTILNSSSIEVLYIIRSVYNYSENNYKWYLTNLQPSKELIELSEDYLIGDIEENELIINNIVLENIYYRTVNFTVEKKKAILLFLELVNNICDEVTIQKLLN